MDAKNEERHWREHHEKQASVKPGHPTYEHYAPAYRTGHEGFHKHPEKKFEDVEADLASDYQKHNAELPWDDARDAARYAWDRLGGVITPRDVDRGVRYD